MFICFFHLQYSIRNVNGKLFKLNRQKLKSWIRGLGTFLFEISFSFLSPLPPLPFFPIKLKSISLMKSKAFKPSLTFLIAIYPWINKILHIFCWRHRILLFAGDSHSNILNTVLCTKTNKSWKLWELGCSIPIFYQELEWMIMKPDILRCFPWSGAALPGCRDAKRGTQQRWKGINPGLILQNLG